MTQGTQSETGRRALFAVGLVATVLAWVVPTSVLVGGQTDSALLLDQGVWVWRASWTAWGLFLVACARGLESGPTPARGLFAGGADRALLIVLLGAIGVRISGLNGPLWFDEAWMWTDWLSLPFGRLVRTFGSDNNHPLYTRTRR